MVTREAENVEPLSFSELAREYLEAAKHVLEDRESFESDDVATAVAILLMDPEILEAALERIAEEYRGCFACGYSIPRFGSCSLFTRACLLGLELREDCEKWTRIR